MYIAAASCSCTVLGGFYVACTVRYLRCCQVEVPRMLRGTRAPLGLFTFFFPSRVWRRGKSTEDMYSPHDRTGKNKFRTNA